MQANFLSYRDICGPLLPIGRGKLRDLVAAGAFPRPVPFGAAVCWPTERVVDYCRAQGMTEAEITARLPAVSARGKRR
jgi:predicted DNA-binding transcriptional regulator AlpA